MVNGRKSLGYNEVSVTKEAELCHFDILNFQLNEHDEIYNFGRQFEPSLFRQKHTTAKPHDKLGIKYTRVQLFKTKDLAN